MRLTRRAIDAIDATATERRRSSRRRVRRERRRNDFVELNVGQCGVIVALVLAVALVLMLSGILFREATLRNLARLVTLLLR